MHPSQRQVVRRARFLFRVSLMCTPFRSTFRAVALGLAAAALVVGCDSGVSELPVEVSFDAVVTPFHIVDDGPETYVLTPVGQNEAYYPLNLPVAFQKPNLRVRVEGLEIREYRVLLHRPLKVFRITERP